MINSPQFNGLMAAESDMLIELRDYSSHVRSTPQLEISVKKLGRVSKVNEDVKESTKNLGDLLEW